MAGTHAARTTAWPCLERRTEERREAAAVNDAFSNERHVSRTLDLTACSLARGGGRVFVLVRRRAREEREDAATVRRVRCTHGQTVKPLRNAGTTDVRTALRCLFVSTRQLPAGETVRAVPRGGNKFRRPAAEDMTSRSLFEPFVSRASACLCCGRPFFS